MTSKQVESWLFLEGLEDKALILVKKRKNIKSKNKDKSQWPIQVVIVPITALKGRKMNLLKFAIIPISKYMGKKIQDEPDAPGVFRTFFEGEPEYAIWPIVLRRQQGKGEDLSLILDLHTEKFFHAANPPFIHFQS